MSVGVEALDVHHRQIWRRVRHLANAVAAGRTDEIRAALRFLNGYLADHHVEEERWMSEAGYPGALEHARGHVAIMERIRAASADEAAGATVRLVEAAACAADALETHMRVDDLKLGRFFTARENLRRLAEEGPGVGMSLTPLPGALAPVVRRRDEGAAEADDDPSAERPGR